jgi:hypothetical protein
MTVAPDELSLPDAQTPKRIRVSGAHRPRCVASPQPVGCGSGRPTAQFQVLGALWDRIGPQPESPRVSVMSGAAGTVNEGSEMEEEKLGGKFWLAIIGGAIACAVAGVLVLLLIGTAWARWGFFGMFLVLSAVLLFVGWQADRREKRRYDSTS